MTTGSFFDVDDADEYDEIPDDPFYMPNGTYRWKIIEAAAGLTKAGDKTGLTVKLQCMDPAFRGNTKYAPWCRIPFKVDKDIAEMFSSDDEDMQAAAKSMMQKLQAQLKKNFAAFGMAADEIRNFKLEDVSTLVGREVNGRITNKTQEDGSKEGRIVAFYPVDEVSGEDGVGGFGQFGEAEHVGDTDKGDKPSRSRAKKTDNVPF